MNMKKTEKGVESNPRALDNGLRRVQRRHVTKPGEVTLKEANARVTMYLDADILEYFKVRAAEPNAAPYQTQINNELRNVLNQAG
jgi:uncharacterized protein (DUF4415 family)